MANLRVKWTLPKTRESGKPLAVEDIKHVRIEVSADDGANYALLGDFPPSVLETEAQDLDFGVYTFRGLVVDTANRVSQPLLAQWENADTTPPGALLSLDFDLL